MVTTFQQSYDTSKVVILGINREESEDVIRAFGQNFGLTYPLLMDTDGSLWLTYRIQGFSPFPLDAIIDQQGILRYLNLEYDPPQMIEIIDNLLAVTGIAPDSASNENSPDLAANIPDRLELSVFPNPTNSAANIRFRVPSEGETRLSLYDGQGRRVIRKILGHFPPGEDINHLLRLETQASGIYFVVIENGRFREIEKLVLLR